MLHIVSMCWVAAAHRISLGVEGHALYPVLSSFISDNELNELLVFLIFLCFRWLSEHLFLLYVSWLEILAQKCSVVAVAKAR